MELRRYNQCLNIRTTVNNDFRTGIRFQMGNRYYFGIVWNGVLLEEYSCCLQLCLKIKFRYLFREVCFRPLHIFRKPNWINHDQKYTIPLERVTHIFMLGLVYYSPPEAFPVSDTFLSLMDEYKYTLDYMSTGHNAGNWFLM